MPDAKDCRCYAETCRRIATENTLSVWDRHSLSYIADRWEQLASELGPVNEPTNNVTSLQEWSEMRSRR